MIILGVDPHKSSHTAAAVQARDTTTLDTITISSATSEYRRLLRWAQRWNERYWAIENADGLGHNLTQWLISHGERVVDVPPTATAKIRALSRGGRRKNDPIDAAAAACVAAIRGESRPVVVEGHTDALALLDERRHTLNRHRTRLLNQLHALLRELIPGGAKRSLSATAAESILRTVTAATIADRVRIQLANDLIDDIRRYDQQLTDNTAQMKQLLDEHTTSLPDLVGVGPVLAARVLASTRDPRRFPTAVAYANYTGTAPVQVASGDYNRHRLSRYGNRELNSAIHSITVIQIRTRTSAGRRYYDRKRAEGKTAREATRCLKRQIATILWRTMIKDAQARENTADPLRGSVLPGLRSSSGRCRTVRPDRGPAGSSCARTPREIDRLCC
ncbi:IS110 family RNA-guided transposase [Nocardia salmonicida]|uniref:IS110 family transposase n=1 Tax=Nocardia salmonicida TaxID=53431 RepID=UPI0007C6B261|nr:IS110 family transposase [Nocardia salmonicida]